MASPACSLCQRLHDLPTLSSDEVVWSFPHSVALLGPWQFYTGYCILIARRHAAELFELDQTVRRCFLDEMCLLAQAIHNAFRPHKINYELLGNQVPHLHWHLFPRAANDPDALRPVWFALDRADHDADVRRKLQSGPRDRPATTALLRQHLTLLSAPLA
jgi:diadenosine tetraphosphate (Ap4A) HIT family hydrolase